VSAAAAAKVSAAMFVFAWAGGWAFSVACRQVWFGAIARSQFPSRRQAGETDHQEQSEYYGFRDFHAVSFQSLV